MPYIDADGHVQESPATFSDAYLDPAFRGDRPRVIGVDGMVYWVIEEQLFPRRAGRGCNNLGTPTRYQGEPALHNVDKPESPDCMELADIGARLHIMDDEGIAVQVIYPTLFLAHPLGTNPALMTALCSSYNRWLGDWLSDQERLQWAAVVNLHDVRGAVREVHEAKRLGAVAVMVLGTVGDRQLDDPLHDPFYAALCEEGLPLAVHVGWACPSINNLYSHIYPSGVIAFHLPVLMGFAALISGGVFDRFPDLAAVFLEAGSMWVPFMIDRLEHRFQKHGTSLSKFMPQTSPIQRLPTMEYIKRGTLYFGTEPEDFLLPQVMELVGERQILMGTDIPHGDRERFAAHLLQERKDLSAAAKVNILERNPARFYGLGAGDAPNGPRSQSQSRVEK